MGKVIVKIPSGVPGEFIGVELNTPMLKDFPEGQDKIRNILEDVLKLANSGRVKEAEELMKNDWSGDLDTLPSDALPHWWGNRGCRSCSACRSPHCPGKRFLPL